MQTMRNVAIAAAGLCASSVATAVHKYQSAPNPSGGIASSRKQGSEGPP